MKIITSRKSIKFRQNLVLKILKQNVDSTLHFFFTILVRTTDVQYLVLNFKAFLTKKIIVSIYFRKKNENFKRLLFIFSFTRKCL